MRVLQINSVCGVGSTGRIATDIHQMLIENGHESFIAYGRGLPINCNNTIKIGSKIDNYSHVMSTRLFDLHGFASKNATHEFVEKIKVLDPDIIHLHNLHGYYINIMILFDYLRNSNKRIIWTLHDCWSFTGHCSHFEFSGCEKWKTQCSNCPEKSMYPASLMIDNSRQNYQVKKKVFTGIENLTIVTPSEWLMGKVIDSFLGEYNVKKINNGVDLNVFTVIDDKSSETIYEGKFVILGVASIWTDRKGFEYFLKLSELIKDDEIIILVGVSKKQRILLPSNIIGIEKTNNIEELSKLYNRADIFVNLTLEDTFPTTNLEALACGTPVVTFITGGSSESITENTGISVQKGNLDSLIDSINQVRNLGKNFYQSNCSIRANRFFDIKKSIHHYLDLYFMKNE